MNITYTFDIDHFLTVKSMRAAFTNNPTLWSVVRDAIQAGCGSEAVYTDILNPNSEA